MLGVVPAPGIRGGQILTSRLRGSARWDRHRDEDRRPIDRRRGPDRRATVTTSASASASTMAVPQTLTLFSLPLNSSTEQISEVVDGAWSLQYMVRGPVWGSAGSIETSLLPTSVTSSVNEEDAKRQALLASFNNAVLFRYANMETLDGFMSHAKTKLMLDEMSSDASKSTRGIASLTFSVDVPNDLESIFRRGDVWEDGVELFMGLRRTGGEDADDADDADADAVEFMALVNQLATSSAYGALQSGVGRVASGDGSTRGVTFHSLHDETGAREEVESLLGCEMIYAVRFEDDKGLEGLLQSPPMQAILNWDDRAPVGLCWGVVQRIVSPEANEKVEKTSL